MNADATMNFTVNGRRRTVTTDPTRPLLDVLREELHLTGAKYGCGESQCGACSVLVDGTRIFSCRTPASRADGKTILTIEGLTRGDRRPDAVRRVPPHALSPAERARIVAVVNEPRFADMPPARIVPALADEGVYLASEASFHRVLRDHGQMNRRGRARPPRTAAPPRTHVATAPGRSGAGT